MPDECAHVRSLVEDFNSVGASSGDVMLKAVVIAPAGGGPEAEVEDDRFLPPAPPPPVAECDVVLLAGCGDQYLLMWRADSTTTWWEGEHIDPAFLCRKGSGVVEFSSVGEAANAMAKLSSLASLAETDLGADLAPAPAAVDEPASLRTGAEQGSGAETVVPAPAAASQTPPATRSDGGGVGCTRDSAGSGETSDEEEEFVVEAILDRRTAADGRPEHLYLVRWQGFGSTADSWVPRANMCSGPLLAAFDAACRARDRARGRDQALYTTPPQSARARPGHGGVVAVVGGDPGHGTRRSRSRKPSQRFDPSEVYSRPQWASAYADSGGAKRRRKGARRDLLAGGGGHACGPALHGRPASTGTGTRREPAEDEDQH